MDVVVIDRQGRPAAGLLARDFVLEVDGVAQPIEKVDVGSNVVAIPPKRDDGNASDVDQANSIGGTAKRILGFFLDEYHVSAGEPARLAQQSLLRFVDEQLGPADLTAAIKPLDVLTSIRVSADREATRAVVASFGGRKDDYAAKTPFEQTFIGRAPAIVTAVRSRVVLSGLRALAARLGELGGGRKAIVLVSEGFDVPSWRDRSAADLPLVIRAANRSGVSIYVVDPGTLTGTNTPAGETASRAADDAHRLANLRLLAEQTGGELVTDPGDLFPALCRVVRDLDTYYQLTYRARHGDDGNFHTVAVRIKTRGLVVRTRSGYWAPSEEIRRLLATLESPPTAAPFRALRQSPLIRTWIGMARGPGGRTRVTFTWEPSARSNDPRRPDPSIVVLNVQAPDGMPLYHGGIQAVRPGVVGPQDVPARAVFDAPPGRLPVELSIQSVDRKPLDSDMREIDIPRLDGTGVVIATPEVLRMRTERDFRAVSGNRDAAPAVSRVFSRTERLLIRVPAYGPDNQPPSVTAMLANRLGQPMRQLRVVPVTVQDGVTEFDLPLAALATGEYRVRVNAAASGSEASEEIRFRVTN